MSINQSIPNLLNICIDQKRNGDYSGRIYHKYQTEAVLFSTIQALMLALERFFDDIHFPQAATSERRFLGKKREINQKGLERVQDHNELLKQQGEVATFVVHIQYRQNATWQGKIMWAEKKKECCFRSALEMIKLMDEAIQTTTAEPIEPVKENW